MCLILPPEIIDLIIDHLHDSHPDLRICARVCRAWLESSRFHLFYSISITPRNQSYPSCHRLYQAIQRSPQIALHVRELSFSTGWLVIDEIPISRFLNGRTLRRNLPWLLRSFIRLRKLELVDTNWALLTPEAREAFRNILALPSLVHFVTSPLSISKLEDFTNLFQPHLKHLDVLFYLRGVPESTARVLDEENAQYAVAERQPCYLEHLSFVKGSSFVGWLTVPRSCLDISKLRILEFSVDRGIHDLMGLIGMSRLSLNSLVVVFKPLIIWKDPIPYKNDFGGMPNLELLYLSVPFRHRKCALHVMDLLSNLVMPNLRQFSLVFRFARHDTDTKWNDWADIDRVLRSPRLRLLRKVKVVLSMPKSCVRDSERYRRKFEEYFPSLISRGIVEIGLQ